MIVNIRTLTSFQSAGSKLFVMSQPPSLRGAKQTPIHAELYGLCAALLATNDDESGSEIEGARRRRPAGTPQMKSEHHRENRTSGRA